MTFIAKLKSKLMAEYAIDSEKEIIANAQAYQSEVISRMQDYVDQMVDRRVRMEVTAFAHLVGEGFANGGTIEEFQGFKNDLIANYPDMSTFDYWAFWRKMNESKKEEDLMMRIGRLEHVSEYSQKLYRKKPIIVEAFQIDERTENAIRIWSQGNVYASPVLERTEESPSGVYWQINTLEGVMTAVPGDYIIKGVKGEFYPCKSDIFEMTYDEVTEHD